MAATPLKHTTIWIPSRTVGERSLVNDPVLQLLPQHTLLTDDW
mgnify:CR=1 FL=1